jgi:CDP-diacylglycerol pyrophosphatase
MERTLTAKRIYSMGQYQNLELIDTISDIPEELSLNDAFIEKLALFQMLRMESRYHKYLIMREKTREFKSEEALVMIEEQITQTSTEMKDIIKESEEK